MPQGGTSENPEDEDVDIDPDENLPWPEPELITAWWDKNHKHFQAGKRYLCGRKITPENCQYILRKG